MRARIERAASRLKVFYVAGPGDAMHAHRNWAMGLDDPTEVSITFSSQVEQACKDAGADLYMIAIPKEKGILRDGSTVIEHRPKPRPGVRGDGLLPA